MEANRFLRSMACLTNLPRAVAQGILVVVVSKLSQNPRSILEHIMEDDVHREKNPIFIYRFDNIFQ